MSTLTTADLRTDPHGFRGRPGPGKPSLDEQIADLEEHDRLWGLGSGGQTRLEALRQFQEAAAVKELVDFNELRDRLADVEQRHAAALDAALAARVTYVEAREVLLDVSREREPIRSEAYGTEVRVPPLDNFATRYLADYDLRTFTDNRAKRVDNSSWPS